ncbi:MAG: hypothetical protein V3R87_09525 [Dehalococcoidia bacterium]
MAKKSRKIATRYSQLSKEGKKRQRNRLSPQPSAASIHEPGREEAGVTRAAPRAAPRPSNVAARPLAGYDYVRDDLRRIGILGGAALVIIVVLTFVLG